MSNKSSQTENGSLVEKLPCVTRVQGLYVMGEKVNLQYLSDQKVYEIEFPLSEILRSDDWFTMIRKQLGEQYRAALIKNK